MNKKLTNEEFIKKAKKVHFDRYDYSLVNYNGSRLKVKIICPEHGEFEQECSSHLQGCGCPRCFGFKQTINDFINQANKRHNNRYKYHLIKKLTDRKQKVKIVCPEHGEFEQIASNHLNGNGCRRCHFENRILTTEKFIEKAKKIHGDLYDYSLVAYNRSRFDITIICKKHGAFKQMANKHLNGHGCQCCKFSKGQIKIREFLKHNNVLFEEQKRFEELDRLSYDFYLTKQNILIEYDGEQHFRPVKIWGGKNGFIKQKQRDEIKTHFAKKENIKLIRIPYTKIKEIDKILTNELSTIEQIS